MAGSLLRRRLFLGAMLAAFILIPAYIYLNRVSRRTPSGQQSLVWFHRGLIPVFRDDFNGAGDRNRVLVFLNTQQTSLPLQRLLDEHGAWPAKVFLIWEPAGGASPEAPSNAQLAVTTDPRVFQFWDPERVVGGLVSSKDQVQRFAPGAQFGAGQPALPKATWAGTLSDLGGTPLE